MVLWLVIGLTTNPKAAKGRRRPKGRKTGAARAQSKTNVSQGAALRSIRVRILGLEGKLAVLAAALNYEFDAEEGKPLILEEE